MPKDKLVKVNKHGDGMARVKPVKHHGDGVSSFTVKNPDKSTYTFRSRDTNFEDANYNPKPLKPKKTKKMKKQRIPRKLKSIKAPDYKSPEVKITAADRKVLSDKSEADKRNKKLARKRKINKLKKNLRAAFTKVRTGVRPKFTAGGPFMVKEDQAYYYKVDGKTVTKAEYTAAHKKGVATPGNKNFTDGKGLQTNDPDAFGYKANTEKARQNNKASKRATVLTKNQTKLNEKTIPFKKTSKFKAHMMYKDGKAVRANTYAKHLELKRKGYTHSK
jgi:hypothetical protein